MKSLLVISRQPPTRQLAREALDVVLAAAAFGVPCGILFMDDGILQLIKDQQAGLIQQKSLAANLQALSIFGVEDILACEYSLSERGVPVTSCTPEVQLLSSAQIASLLERYDQVLTL